MKNSILFKRDNKSKIRIVYLNLNEYVDQNNNTFYSISGETGIFNGKLVKRPLVTIDKGKSTRTVKEQAELQYQSLINSYLDKGYKLSSDLNINNVLDEGEVESKVPMINTDTKGVTKPMLAKQYRDVPNFNWDKEWYASFKLDGVRAFIFKQGDKLTTSSRGGKDYNIAATYILNDPKVQEIFEKYPGIILDGELYIHGKPLSYISGLCRLETLDERHKELTFHCYDIVDEEMDFKSRLEILIKLLDATIIDSTKIRVLDHYQLSDKTEIFDLHNKAVSMGYEGLILRDPDKPYKGGSRDRMFKIKEFSDDEFKILDIVEGLREEDMCFLMETKEGHTFKAKPMGDRNLKQWYRKNIDSLKGKMGTVKYFGYTNTDTPVPNLPVFKCLRDNSDL